MKWWSELSRADRRQSRSFASRYPLVPSWRNVEKWRCRASVIKLHLQSTLHYNTTAYASRLQVGIPVQISRGRVTNDWQRRRHRKKKKNCFAAPAKGSEEMCVPLGPGQSLMISLLFAHQFKPRHPLYTPRHRRYLARTLAKCLNTILPLCVDLTIFSKQFNTFPDICLHQDVTYKFLL